MILRDEKGNELYVLMIGVNQKVFAKLSDMAKEKNKTISDFLAELISKKTEDGK